jgi:hypothetical protein
MTIPVEFAHEKGRFFVGEERYLVDAAAHDGNAECSCRDWICRCFPAYKQSKTIVPYGEEGRTQCKHINAVRLFLGGRVMEQMSKQ